MMNEILFNNVRIVDPELETVSGLVDVKIQDGQIAKIGSDLDQKCDMQIEGDGRYMLPGLIDCHVHPRSEERRVGKECRSRWRRAP